MKEEFSTIDITRLTPAEKLLAVVGKSARPGNMCELKPGFILNHELESIANHLSISKNQLTENMLQSFHAYGKKIHKPKHSPKIKKTGPKITDAFHEMPYGDCIFLDKDSGEHRCRIEDVKPLHCKLATESAVSEKIHSWFILNHFVDSNDPHSLREWGNYLKTHRAVPGGELHELVKDKNKLAKVFDKKFHEKLDQKQE